jgi:hypothetical protein
LLEEEKLKLAQGSTADLGDDLDAYMTGLSSQLGMQYTPVTLINHALILEFQHILFFITNMQC